MRGLLASLKAYRLEEARKKGQPAFCIFSNKVLDAIVAEVPQTKNGLLAIKGMGPQKVANYGAGILMCCKKYNRGNNGINGGDSGNGVRSGSASAASSSPLNPAAFHASYSAAAAAAFSV